MCAAFQAPHQPNEAPPETIAKYAQRLADHANPVRHRHAALVDELDQAIGEVLIIYVPDPGTQTRHHDKDILLAPSIGQSVWQSRK